MDAGADYSAKGSTQPLATLATLAGRALAGVGLPPGAAPSDGVRRASGRLTACLTGFGAGAASSAIGAAAAGAGTAAALGAGAAGAAAAGAAAAGAAATGAAATGAGAAAGATG